MAWTDPVSKSVGDPTLTTDFNLYVNQNTRFLHTPPSCRAYNSGNQDIPNITWTSLVFDSERWDTDVMHSTSTNTARITAVTAGIYLVSGGVQWAANTTGQRGIAILHSAGSVWVGEDLQEATSGGVLGNRMRLSTLVRMAAGSYVELQVWQNSGGNLNVEAVAQYASEFEAMWQSGI